MHLALRLKLKPHESILSFLSRLSRKHDVAFVQDFVSDMGVSWPDIVQNNEHAIEQISALTEIPLNVLNRNTFLRQEQGIYTLNGHRLSRNNIHRNEVQICPECLMEDHKKGEFEPYMRSYWLIRSHRICQKHKRPLMALYKVSENCHDMDYANIITGNWKRIQSEAQRSSFCLSQEAMNWTKYLFKRLNYDHTNTPFLDQLDVDIVGKFCEYLGVLIVRGPNPNLENLNQREWIEAGASGFAVASQGPGAIGKVYSCLQNTQSPLNTCGYTDELGFFYRWLSRPNDERTHPIRQHIHDHICNSYPVPSGAKVAGIVLRQRLTHSWPSAAKEAGISEGATYRLRDEICKNPEHWRSFPVDEYALEFEMLSRGLKRYQAAKYLGMSIEVFDQLVSADLIHFCIELKYAGKLFRKEDLDKFLKNLKCKASRRHEEGNDTLPILMACKNAKVRLSDAIQAISLGKLKDLSLDDKAFGINRVRLDPNDLISYFDNHHFDSQNEIHADDLKKLLSIDYPTASFLMNEGYVPCVPKTNPRNGMTRRAASEQSLESFQQKYITLGELGRINNKQVRSIFCALANQNIFPLSDIPTSSRIYLRQEIPEKFLQQ